MGINIGSSCLLMPEMAHMQVTTCHLILYMNSHVGLLAHADKNIHKHTVLQHRFSGIAGEVRGVEPI